MKILSGAEVHIGQPAIPNRKLARLIARLLTSFPEIQEAHFPQCFAPRTMSKPAQVLMLVFNGGYDASEAMTRVNESLVPLLGHGTCLDVWPIQANDAALESVRAVGCRIFERALSGKIVVDDPWSPWHRLLRRLRGR